MHSLRFYRESDTLKLCKILADLPGISHLAEQSDTSNRDPTLLSVKEHSIGDME